MGTYLEEAYREEMVADRLDGSQTMNCLKETGITNLGRVEAGTAFGAFHRHQTEREELDVEGRTQTHQAAVRHLTRTLR